MSIEALPPVPVHEEVIDERGLMRRPWIAVLNALLRGRSLVECTHSDRLAGHAPEQYRVGTRLHEIDRDVYYIRRDRSAYTYVRADSAAGGTTLSVAVTAGYAAGDKIVVGEGTAREEVRFVDAVVAGPALTLNRALTYTHTAAQADKVAVVGPAWVYASGVMRGTLGPDTKPADLNAKNDVGFRFHATDFSHTYTWLGAAGATAPDGTISATGWYIDVANGELGSTYIEWRTVAPHMNGWHIADGTAGVTVTGRYGNTVTVTMPNLVGAYPKGAAAYTGAVVAAVAPGLTGAPGGTVGAIPANTATQTVQSGVGATVPTSNHPHAAPTFTGDIGTLAADATAEPAHVNLLPYYRL